MVVRLKNGVEMISKIWR